MKKILLIILLLLTSHTAYAENEIDSKYFKDWLTLTELLRSKGIDPSAPSWSAIIPMCLPLKKSDDETDYNRCLYEKTTDEYQWPIDKKYCKAKAEKEYREYLVKERESRTIILTDRDGKTSIVTREAPLTTPASEPLTDRNTYYNDCLTGEKNWNNSERWTMGRHESRQSKQ